VQPEQQLQQHPAARHLRDHIGEIDDDGPQHRCGQCRRAFHAVEDHISDRVGPGVAQRLGDDEKHCAERDQRPDCVERTVGAVECRQPGEAEERGGAAPVTGQGEPVLRCREALARRVEIGRSTGAPRGPHRDREGEGKDRRENADCDAVHDPPPP
jgi:hypothetical protein